MTRDQIIERITDSFTDMSGECPSDYADLDPITIEEATEYLADARADERSADLTPDECLPAETTPELYQIAMNCFIRYMQHEYRIERLAEFIEENEDVCLHNQYFNEYPNKDPEVIPIDFLDNEDTFPFNTGTNDKLSITDLILIGMNSSRSFNPNHVYCWYNKEKHQLCSSNTPFADGVIHAEPLARYALSPDGSECLEELLGYMDEDDIENVFRCDEETIRKLYFLS